MSLAATRALARVAPRATRVAAPRRAYTPAPALFGAYDVLDPASALQAYPDPLDVPPSIPRPDYVPPNFFTAPIWEHEAVEVDIEAPGERIKLGSRAEARVRKVAALAAEVLAEVGKLIKPGVTTAQLDAAAHALIVARGAYPSPLGYQHFPKSITTSVNNVIAHGIPDDRPLLPDDIVNVDLTLFHDGYHGDTSATFVLPEVDAKGRELVAATEEALELAIAACVPGRPFSDIGKVIEEFTKKHGLGINNQFSGHGIGKRFHQPPWIVHYRNSEHGRMQPGDCFTIEPALTQGCKSRGTLWEDGWTVSTDVSVPWGAADVQSKARSAQFEHQVLITGDGVDKILVRGIIAKTMATRKDLYLLDGIVGCVDNHGNDRTSKKVAQILETLAAAFKLEKGAVSAGKAKGTVKREGPAATTPPKKRRRVVKASVKTESQDESDEAEFTP
ncbi:Methionine aminopeptidase 1D, chloroplastic/mitochondrial [Vanrija albida]|uniref:Methionine aminopeptidase n=1 Tax=Vanrija albida TaxID=181172 RepID=A0ABR3Q9X5_9TREE